MIDDTPEAVLLSCFDPVRRETARMTLTELVADGRIHPARIEEVHERSKSQIQEVKERLELATAQFGRASELLRKGVGVQADFDRSQAAMQALEQQHKQAQTDERIAAEKLKSGSASLEATRQALASAEANERKIRTEYTAQVDGQNPEVRETAAMLDKARYDLDQTVVRAPTEATFPRSSSARGRWRPRPEPPAAAGYTMATSLSRT